MEMEQVPEKVFEGVYHKLAWRPCDQAFLPPRPTHDGSIQNLVLIGQAVLEEPGDLCKLLTNERTMDA